MKIVVIGGTGLIGSKLVDRLRSGGHEAVAASPDTGVNTITGEGLADVLAGAEAVVDVSNAPMSDDSEVLEFFQTSSRNLLAAEARAGVRHHVALSIVGADRLPQSGYLRAKVAQEEIVKAGPVPYTILRATQFFEFIGGIADSSAVGDTIHLPPVYVQPESADDVAEALAEIALGKPVNGTVELGGPIVLVAHSYGGFVITNAAKDNATVQALVYIDSFMPDEGESLGALAARAGSCIDESALNPVPFDGGVDLYLRWDANPPYPGFADGFANGVEPKHAAVLAAAQRPAAAAQFEEASGPPAWKTIPSWSLIGMQDRVIPVALQEEMSRRAGAHITRVEGGHLTPITRPGDVTEVILSAIAGTSVARPPEVAKVGS